MKTNRLILTVLAAALAGCASPRPTISLDPADAGQPALLKPAENPLAANTQPVARLEQPAQSQPTMSQPTMNQPTQKMTVMTRPSAERPVNDSSASMAIAPGATELSGEPVVSGEPVMSGKPVATESGSNAQAGAGMVSVQPVDLEKAGSMEPVTRVTNGVDAAQAAYVSGKRALGERQFDKAIALFRNARNLAPELVDAHAGLGVALSMASRHDEALGAFVKAVELEPDNARWHANLGLAYARTGNFQQAQQSLARAWSLKPGDARIEAQLERVTAAARSAGVAPLSRVTQVNQAGSQQGVPAPTQLVQVRDRVFDLNLNGAEAPPMAGNASQPVASGATDADSSQTMVHATTHAAAAKAVQSAATTRKKTRVLKFATAPAAAAVSDAAAGRAISQRVNRAAPKARKPVSKVAKRKPVATKAAPVAAARTVVAKATVAKATVAKAPVKKSPVKKAPVAKAPVKKAPVAKAKQPRPVKAQAPKSVKPAAAPVVKGAKAAVTKPTESRVASKPKKRVKSRKVRGMVITAPSQAAGQRVVDFLSSNGLSAVRVGQSGGVQPLTEIHYRPGYERDVQDVRKAFPVRTYSVVQTNMPTGINVQVIVGRDLRALSGAKVTDTATR